MRIASKLARLAASVCVVMAFTAASASALTVNHESGGACGTVTEVTGGSPEFTTTGEVCKIAGSATDLEFGGAFGVMSICDLTFEGWVTGSGIATGLHSIVNCMEGTINSTVCTGLGDRHLNGNLKTESTGEAGFCVVSSGLTNRCFDLPFTIAEVSHIYTFIFSHTNKCANGVNSLQGTIVQTIDAAHPKVEIND